MTTGRTFVKDAPKEGCSRSSGPMMFFHALERQCSTGCPEYQRRASWWKVPAFSFLPVPQWSAIEVDDDERAVVWSESVMTAAFHCFLLEPSWHPFQAINKPVLGSFAAAFDSSLVIGTCSISSSARQAYGLAMRMRVAPVVPSTAVFSAIAL